MYQKDFVGIMPGNIIFKRTKILLGAIGVYFNNKL